MAKCEAVFKEVRFEIQPELTQAFFLIQAVGDCPIGVQGWHHKTFPASMNCTQILQRIERGEEDPLMWNQGVPTM